MCKLTVDFSLDLFNYCKDSLYFYMQDWLAFQTSLSQAGRSQTTVGLTHFSPPMGRRLNDDPRTMTSCIKRSHESVNQKTQGKNVLLQTSDSFHQIQEIAFNIMLISNKVTTVNTVWSAQLKQRVRSVTKICLLNLFILPNLFIKFVHEMILLV